MPIVIVRRCILLPRLPPPTPVSPVRPSPAPLCRAHACRKLARSVVLYNSGMEISSYLGGSHSRLVSALQQANTYEAVLSRVWGAMQIALFEGAPGDTRLAHQHAFAGARYLPRFLSQCSGWSNGDSISSVAYPTVWRKGHEWVDVNLPPLL